MITARQLKLLTTCTAGELTHMIQAAGYKRDTFQGADFLGMTNANQFCYHASYIDEGALQGCKVFVSIDPTTAKVTADY
jgi:hypothetical protein